MRNEKRKNNNSKGKKLNENYNIDSGLIKTALQFGLRSHTRIRRGGDAKDARDGRTEAAVRRVTCARSGGRRITD